MPETAAATGTGIAAAIKQHGLELGFQQVGISDVDLSDAEQQLVEWLARDFHGDMHYMQKHGYRRSRPAELVPGTIRVISARMDYYPEAQAASRAILDDSEKAYVSRYALGRDYHKVLRGRLKKLAKFIEDLVGPLGHRVFVDSAPVLEKPLAQKAGLGWIGKHTNLINKDAGSWFFLGELFVDIDLPVDKPAKDHCGTCRACIDVCPTQAIVAPYVLDARRCISYLTIENRNSIPLEFRKAIGNRIYGCDDCQLFCPWNKFAKTCVETDFAARHDLDVATLLKLFAWDEDEWLARTEGSAIRRLSFEQWLRNIAVALGNVDTNETVIAALRKRKEFDSALVREHVCWALAQHGAA
ncbi:MAG: tRNA epoxyqueuosine(34) reductase QueG [Gammaproteobacteria bacterium]|nr:tRNA epoxyqueuosine(34) reductase QueG [Gammaproteobacteria bacterium]